MTKPKPPLRRRQPETEVIVFRATKDEIRAAVQEIRRRFPEAAVTQNLAFRMLALSALPAAEFSVHLKPRGSS